MTDWLKQTWSNSHGMADFRGAVKNELSSGDAGALVQVLERGSEDEQYMAQIAMRLLGGEVDVVYDRHGDVHYLVRVPDNGRQTLITPRKGGAALAAPVQVAAGMRRLPQESVQCALCAGEGQVTAEAASAYWVSVGVSVEQQRLLIEE